MWLQEGLSFQGVKTFEQAEEVQFFILVLFKVQLPFGTFKLLNGVIFINSAFLLSCVLYM